ncbi:MAG: AAA family ATPase [Clostridia bacterium]|nr:AAA family ATPase [Clostridia bacterium]
MEKFVNRTKELETLEKQYKSNTSSLVIVYGRRRVGKTSLITEFLKRHKDTLYFLATEESEMQNLNAFKLQVAEYTKNELLKSASVDWLTVFKTLVNYKTETKKIIVIDEFQYIGKANAAFPSIMQKVWDTLLSNENIMLILCGSLISLMKSQTLDYGSPLYGRRTAQIKLKQIAFKHYGEFYENMTAEELIPFYAVTGGVPKYIEVFRGYNDVYEAIQENVLNQQSFLYEEPYFLLQREVTEIGSYFSLIKTIAMGNRKLSEIASSLDMKATSLTKYLKVLTDLDLIKREVPATEVSSEKSKSGLYRITDNYIAFWFKYIYPYRSYLEKGEDEYVMAKIKEGFIQNFASFVYEDVCREKMWELSAQGKTLSFEKIGRYWGSKAGEIDIVAVGNEEKNLVLGECKYTKKEKGLELLHALQEKTPAIMALTGVKNVQYIIFSTAGFTKGLRDEAKKNANVVLVDSL